MFINIVIQISEDDIDYYKAMGCENYGKVTEAELERLDMLEEDTAYPPRFRLKFSRDGTSEHYQNSQEVIVAFNEVLPSFKNTIELEGDTISLPLSPSLSVSSTNAYVNSFNIGRLVYNE